MWVCPGLQEKATKMTYPGPQLSLWPVHPQPFDDELLSSWIIRLAHGNGFKAQTFTHGYFESGKNFWAADVDRTIDLSKSKVLIEKTGQTEARIASLSLRRFEGTVFESLFKTGHVNWLMPVGIRARAFQRSGLMICPACLKESKEAYLKNHWRMAWSTVCIVHQRLLFDQCPKCNSPIQPHLVDRKYRTRITSQTSLANCAKCGLDLKAWEAFQVASDEAIKRQKLWEFASTHGYIPNAESGSLHSLAYFSGLRIIAQFLLAEHPEKFSLEGHSKLVERLTLGTRHTLFEQLWDLLIDWPERFIPYCNSRSAPYTKLVGARRVLPWWLHSVCRSELHRGTMRMTVHEAEYIRDAVRSNSEGCGPQSIRAAFGRDISRYVAVKKTTVPVSVAYQLFDYLDRAARQSYDNKLERYAIQRDKVMLISAQGKRLSQRTLINMSVAEVVQLGINDLSEPLLKFPIDEGSLARWLNWYVWVVRAPFIGAGKTQALFLTSLAKPMSESLVGQRLMKHFRLAGVASSFPSYSIWTNAACTL